MSFFWFLLYIPCMPCVVTGQHAFQTYSTCAWRSFASWVEPDYYISGKGVCAQFSLCAPRGFDIAGLWGVLVSS